MGEDTIEEDYGDEVCEAPTPLGERLRMYAKYSDEKVSTEDVKKREFDRKAYYEAKLNNFLTLQSAVFDSNIDSNQKIEIIELIGKYKDKWENALLSRN